MTLPYERRYAIANARAFLWELLDPKVTPRVPKPIRKRAARLLKHYPHDFDMVDVSKAFGEPAKAPHDPPDGCLDCLRVERSKP